MLNLKIVQILNNIADILEIQEINFKPRAYRNAARSIEELSEDIVKIYQQGKLKELPGIGESIAEKIEEIILTGKLKYYEQLKQKVPIEVEELNLVPGLGPKKIKVLYQKLKVRNIADLEKVLKLKKVSKLTGFGEETEKNLLKNIELIKSRPKRMLYYQAIPLVKEIKDYMLNNSPVDKVEIAGSFRRGKETIGDLDFLATTKNPEKVINIFTKFKEVKEILAKGKTKSSVLLNNGLQVDIRVTKPSEFGSALLYFTGNKEHNIELRKLALSKGYTLSEYGLFKLKNKQLITSKSEDQIYKKLGLQYIHPELRENMGEIQAAKKNQLPHLVTEKDIQGVFHNHSKWSDGNNNLLEMAQKAQELGLKFISFNDHFGSVGITNPLNEKRLNNYIKEIEKVRKKVKIKVLSGIEIDILKDGKLPLSKQKLKQLDMVIASVHLATKMSEAEMTKRVCGALNNYKIDILGHPTDRLINEREPIAINLEKVFEVARNNNVFLEINSSPNRVDLSFNHIKAAKELGCKFALSTDAHDLKQLEFYKLGVINARRGWLEKKDLLNCSIK